MLQVTRWHVHFDQGSCMAVLQYCCSHDGVEVRPLNAEHLVLRLVPKKKKQTKVRACCELLCARVHGLLVASLLSLPLTLCRVCGGRKRLWTTSS